MEKLVLYSHQKDLIFDSGSGFSILNSWEPLDLFDYEYINTNQPYFFFNPETREIEVREAGVYRFDYYAQIETDIETSIYYKIRFNIDATPYDHEYLLDTETDQIFSQQIKVDEPITILFEIYAISDEDLVIRSKAGKDFLIITKEI